MGRLAEGKSKEMASVGRLLSGFGGTSGLAARG